MVEVCLCILSKLVCSLLEVTNRWIHVLFVYKIVDLFVIGFVCVLQAAQEQLQPLEVRLQFGWSLILLCQSWREGFIICWLLNVTAIC